ncbi:MAG: hypothetical protein IKF47_04290 [Bacilli bacterium]|nr:hypothetical protein [Bacilli bacterium]
MKDILRFIKKHSHIIVIALIIIFLVIIGIMAKNFFFPSDNEVYYGTRLEGIDKVKISDKKKEEFKEYFKESSKKINVRLAGRIIYFNVTVNDDVSVDTARELSNKTLEKLSEDEKAYYDIQFIISNDKDKDHFPIIGYKHHTKTAISWTKNR